LQVIAYYCKYLLPEPIFYNIIITGEIMNSNSMFNFETEEQKDLFLEKINQENCGDKLILIRNELNMTKRDLAHVLGCSESTISRIENNKTKPTKDFMNRLICIVLIGYSKFSSLSKKDKKYLENYLGAVSGVLSGTAGAIGVVSSSGTAGLSAAGITSGLAAIGGSMSTGLGVIASIPIAAGFIGFGISKGIKAICEANDLNCKEIDGRYEIIKKNKVN
jgi:DNA-binding XRE family transcriptional regulator